LGADTESNMPVADQDGRKKKARARKENGGQTFIITADILRSTTCAIKKEERGGFQQKRRVRGKMGKRKEEGRTWSRDAFNKGLQP